LKEKSKLEVFPPERQEPEAASSSGRNQTKFAPELPIETLQG